MSETRVVVQADLPIGTISPRIYGQFAEHLGRCYYDGLWVGTSNTEIANTRGWRTDALQALKAMPVPLLRWPGGCYADHYHWRDGIGANRPVRLGMSCGLTVEDDNRLGTHEFLDYCKEIGAEPYLAGNMGSGTPQELCDWVEYCNTTLNTNLGKERKANGSDGPWNVKLWGVGNENWGCGGNYTAEQYALEYKRYSTMLRHVDSTAELVVCGLTDDWNRVIMHALKDHLDLVDHVSIHRYWSAGPAVDFSEEEYYKMISTSDETEPFLQSTAQIIEAVTRGRKKVGIALDEWGVWAPEAKHTCNYEQVSPLRDAIATAITFEVFHRQCNVLTLANLAQVANVLHAPVQTSGTDFWRTPTYHAFNLYAPHIGATALHTLVDGTSFCLPDGSAGVSATSSVSAVGDFTVSLINRHLDKTVQVRLTGAAGSSAAGRLLTAESPRAANSASTPNAVVPIDLDVTGDSASGWTCALPRHSIATVTVRR